MVAWSARCAIKFEAVGRRDSERSAARLHSSAVKVQTRGDSGIGAEQSIFMRLPAIGSPLRQQVFGVAAFEKLNDPVIPELRVALEQTLALTPTRLSASCYAPVTKMQKPRK